MIVLIVLCCFISVAAAVAYYIKKKKDDDAAAAEDAANTKAMKQKVADDPDFFTESTGVTVDCQNLSNTKLGWPGHKGLVPIEDWGNFNFQKCSTYPTAYTSNKALFSTFYANLGPGTPKHDPALTDQQSLDNSGNYSVENIVSKSKLEFSGTGILSLKNGSGATMWSTPGGASGTYTLKFDQDNFNNGNLCVFDKDGNTKWCMLPKVTVPTQACSGDGCPSGSYSGADLASYQKSLLQAGNIKAGSDSAPRFVMIDDTGNFCMYRGTPGNEQGAPIVCK
jgi:hypothetical protein